jgi:hypothetical protein
MGMEVRRQGESLHPGWRQAVASLDTAKASAMSSRKAVNGEPLGRCGNLAGRVTCKQKTASAGEASSREEERSPSRPPDRGQISQRQQIGPWEGEGVAFKQWWKHSTILFTFGVVSGCLKTGVVERSAHVVYSKLQPAV